MSVVTQVHRCGEWPKVAIIVLNWNGWRDTIECLESMQQITYPNYTIIIVDNGSMDDSVKRIKSWAVGDLSAESDSLSYDALSKPVYWMEHDLSADEGGGETEQEEYIASLPSSRRLVIIQNRENLGFAAGNNVGILYALKRDYAYIGLLNNDTVVEQSFVTKIVETFKNNPEWMAIGPKILYKDNPKVVWHAGGRLKLRHAMPIVMGTGQLDDKSFIGEHETELVCGCALFARRSLFGRIGLLDEDFFFGHEDFAYSIVAKKLGLKFGVNLDAIVLHKCGGSLCKGDPIQAYFSNKNRLLVLKKYGSFSEQIVGFSWYSCSRLIKFPALIATGQATMVHAEIRAICDFLAGRYGDFDRRRANGRV